MKRTGVLLLNLGTPNGPDAESVRVYLKEFLMDPYVVDISYPARWLLVNGLIAPLRSKKSAALYRKVWTLDGSPLMVFTQALCQNLQVKLGEGFDVQFAMRYQSPSIASALAHFKGQSIERLLVVPLYPQYSLAATESSIQKVKAEAANIRLEPPIEFVPAFYDHPEFINAFCEVSRPFLEKEQPDKVLFSFHGLPERQVKKTDMSANHCLVQGECCEKVLESNQNCYRAQCYATARQMATQLALDPSQYLVAFQSRLGRTPWIRPYSDEYYEKLPAQGVKRLVVISPSFVADCLETLEEIAIRGKEQFCAAGGEALTLVPSLNAEPVWVGALASIVRENLA